MAAPKKSELQFNLIDGVTKVLRGIGSGLSGLNQQFANLNQTVELGQKALAALGDGFGLGSSLKEAGQLEDILARVQLKTGATADEMDGLEAAVSRALGNTRFTGEQAAQGLATLAESGLDATDAAQQLGDVLAFAQANALGASDAAGGLADTLDQFGEPAAKIGAIADALTAVATKAGTSGKQLQDGLLATGVAAEQAGLGVEQTVAALGALATAGIEGGKAGQRLQLLLQQLADPATKAGEALRALGLDASDFNAVLAKLGTDSSAAETVLAALGQRPRQALQALLQDGGGALAQFNQIVRDSGGASQEAADKLNQTFLGSLDRIAAAYQQAKDVFLAPLLPKLAEEVNNAADAIRAFIQTADFKQLSQQFSDFVITGVKGFQDLVKGVDFGSLINNIKEFGSSAVDIISKIGEAASITASVVNKIGNAFGALKNTSQIVGNLVTGDLDEASEAADRFRKNMDQIGGVEPNIALTAARAKELGIELGYTAEASKGLGAAAEDLAAKGLALPPTLDAIGESSVKMATDLLASGAKLSEVKQQIADAAAATVTALVQIGGLDISRAVGLVAELVSEISRIPESAEGGAERTRAAFASISAQADASASEIYTSFREALTAAGDERSLIALRSALADVAKSGKLSADQIGSAFAALENKLRGVGAGVSGALSSAFDKLNIESKAKLTETAAAAAAAFAQIEAGARTGAATVDDVRAAFVAYAQAQLAAVATADPFERAQVEAMLRVKAEALGVVDALQQIGVAGADLGSKVASGATAAAASLSSVAAATNEVAAATAAAGNAAAQSAQQEAALNQQYNQRSLALGEVSRAFKTQIEELFVTQGGGGRLFGAYERAFTELTNRMLEQKSVAQQRLEQLREEAEKYDPLAREMRKVRDENNLLGESMVRAIAQEQLRLKSLKETAAQTAQEIRKTIQASSSFGGGNPNGPGGGNPNGPGGGNPNGPGGGNPNGPGASNPQGGGGSAPTQVINNTYQINGDIDLQTEQGLERFVRRITAVQRRIGANSL